MNAAVRRIDYALLMSGARDPADIATLVFGGVLMRFDIQGLDDAAMARLMGRYFPRAPAPHAPPPAEDRGGADPDCGGLPEHEFGELHALLREHRRDDSEETDWVARAIVSACAGGNHLWEDMGLPDRSTLSGLIRRYFPTLYHKNVHNLRWKKHFYRQLCERAEARLCKAPSCGACSDYVSCFGGG